MDDITSRALVSDPETRRALQLDSLSAMPSCRWSGVTGLPSS